MNTIFTTIIALFISATAVMASGNGGSGEEMSLLGMFFIGFGVLIIMFQFVPGIILLAGLLKGVLSLGRKKTPESRTD
jgi:hypothetical protein